MKLKKPKFWDYKKPSFLSYLLLPFSIILGLITNPNNKKNYLKIAKIGKKILNETKDEINSLFNNEIKKT